MGEKSRLICKYRKEQIYRKGAWEDVFLPSGWSFSEATALKWHQWLGTGLCPLWWQGGGVGGHHLLLKTTGVNLTNTMNKFSMAILNKDLSSIHSSQQPLEPTALKAGLCTNAPVTKLSVFCPFPEGCCHPCVTGRKTGYREDEKLTQSHRPSELEKYNPRVHLKSPGP